MRKLLAFIFLILAFTAITANAQTSVLFPRQGGTGASSTPLAGQILIGTSGGRYIPAYLQAGANITFSTSSGGITIGSTASGGSATTTINGAIGPEFSFSSPSSTIRLATTTGAVSFDLASLLISQFSNDTGFVTSSIVNGYLLQNGNGSSLTGLTTTQITEGTKLFYTDARARGVWNQDLYSTSSPSFTNLLTVGGTATSTITGDGTDSVIGGALTIQGEVLNMGTLVSLGTGGGGIIDLYQQVGAGGTTASLDLNSLTGAKTFTFPDKNGTFAMLDDISGGSFTTTTITIGSVTLSTTTYVFASSSDTNIHLRLTGADGTATFTPAWSGNLAVARGGTATTTFTRGVIIASGTDAMFALATSSLGLQPTITLGTTAQYFRGDLSLATLNQSAVAGLLITDSPTFAGVSTTVATSTNARITNLTFTTATGTTLCLDTCRTSWPSGTFTTTTISVNSVVLSTTTYVFASSSDTNIHLRLTGSGGTVTHTPIWDGNLAVSRGGTATTTHIKGVAVASGTDPFRTITGTNGQVLTASSTAPYGFSFETSAAGGGITSLNGSTASTQTFASSVTGRYTEISTTNGTHTFNAITSDSIQRRMGQNVNAGLNTVTSNGIAAPVLAGTLLSADDPTCCIWLRHNATAVLQASSGVYSAFTLLRPSYEPMFSAKVKSPTSTADRGMWVGLFSAHPAGSSTPLGHYVGFRSWATTTLTDTNWKFVTRGGGATTTIDTGVPVTASSSNIFKLQYVSSTPKWYAYINGVLVASSTTNLPSVTTTLGYAIVSVNLRGAQTTSHYWSWLNILHN